MTARSSARLALSAALLATAGCAPSDGFPSLAQRPAERNVSLEAPVHPDVDVPSDPAVHSRVTELERQAQEGERSFEATLGSAAAAVGAAGPAGSDRWVEAQQALSRLEAARGPTTTALSELDALAISRAEVPTSGEDFAAIHAAIVRVEGIAAAQQERLDRLRVQLAGGG